MKNLQDKPSMKNLFTVEMALLVILETGRDVREDEQLNISCFKMSVGHEMVTKLANPTDQVEKIKMVGGHKTVTELANPSDQEVEGNKKFKLCDTAVPAKNSSVMHQEMHDEMNDEVYGVMYAEMYAAMSSTAFNREHRTEYNIYKPVYIQQCDNIYETAYSQQIHTYTNAMEQYRDVDEQVGITMTHLAYCWDANK